jgi:hypothetical protein
MDTNTNEKLGWGYVDENGKWRRDDIGPGDRRYAEAPVTVSRHRLATLERQAQHLDRLERDIAILAGASLLLLILLAVTL